MTNSNGQPKNQVETDRQSNDTHEVEVQTRRSAIGLSIAGGFAAMLAACGKYVTKFDKRGLDSTTLGSGDAEEKPNPTQSAKSTPTPTATATATATPEPPKPCPRLGFDLSKATKVADTEFFVADAKALYGHKFSSLLAVKLQKAKASSPAVGELVHILLKKSATESHLAASRRVRSTDVYGDGIGLVFESLHLENYEALQVVVAKGGTQYVAELPIAYASTHNGEPVYDLGMVRTDLSKSKELFELGFGDSSAPSMFGTSNIETDSQSLGRMNHNEGNYKAATSTSTWNVNALLAGDLKNIFGQSMTESSRNSSKLLHEHQSLVVYRKVDKGHLRYFIYVG